jgi:CheY-like chemotaxis protein
MACFLIIDDNADHAQKLADSLMLALKGEHNVACVGNLDDYRGWRRSHRADLILVELMRHQSNGFSLAAALARQTKSPVVLLSDRRLESDLLWAAARGIRHVLSRRAGTAVLAQQLQHLLTPLRPTGLSHPERPAELEPGSMPGPLPGPIAGPVSKVNLSDVDRQQPMVADSCSSSKASSEAVTTLTALIREMVADIYALLQSSPAVQLTSMLSATPCAARAQRLCHALSFLPAAEHLSAAAIASGTVRHFIWRIESLLATDVVSAPPGHHQAVGSDRTGQVMRVLQQQIIQPEPSELALILCTLGVLPPNHQTLKASLAERYGGHYNCPPIKPMAGADSAVWLERMLGLIEATLGGIKPVHQRLSAMMVSVYKLRASLQMSAEHGFAEPSTWQGWQMIAACLYHYSCHCLLRPDLFSDADLNSLCRIISDLRQSAGNGVLPPDELFNQLAAAEICAGRWSQASDGLEHQMLAAGLHQLPKPDGIVSALLGDIRQSGTSLSEISHELQLLTEGASRLGVMRVESLSRLMQDCYLLLSREPERLQQQKKLRLVLGRAHRVLCRLLDQAAAWRPLDEPHLEIAAQKSIHELFMLFPQARQGSPASETESLTEHLPINPSESAAEWKHCQSINTRLRQILRQRGNINEYRSLMTELLREQHTLMAKYLPYQPVI